MADGKRILTHEMFFAAATALKQHKNKFESERPSFREAAEEVGRLVGFGISKTSMTKLMKAAEVNWVPKRKGASSASAYHSRHAIVALARAVMGLYVDLGKPPTQGLQRVYDLINNENAI